MENRNQQEKIRINNKIQTIDDRIEELTLSFFGECPRLPNGEIDIDIIQEMVDEVSQED